MIVDASAVLAVLFDEPDADRYARAIAEAPRCGLSAAGFLEIAIVLESRAGPEAADELDHFLDRAAIEVAPVTAEHAQVARRAWRRFGKGNHPAGLNFGDCFAYALAETAGEPLLFKGGDFTLTDVEAAP
ncbi:MAG: type II toxin-antitoxin system VapC family toxin [Chloroflexi bacterium]|nr:type II toxin-antitoxin system VapC family toxin [Chloroflexota bacterium]